MQKEEVIPEKVLSADEITKLKHFKIRKNVLDKIKASLQAKENVKKVLPGVNLN